MLSALIIRTWYEKVFNLLKSILDTVRERAGREPYLISIGERAELIASLYKQRQSTTQKTLENLKDIVEEINADRREPIMPVTTAEVMCFDSQYCVIA